MNRYPLLLSIGLAALLLGGCGSSSASPTATAKPKKVRVVITATPQPTAIKVTVVMTATAIGAPNCKKGKRVVTPLPGQAPPPSFPGLHIGMVARPMSIVHNIQRGADAGDKRYTYYRNPYAVLKRDLSSYGFKPRPDMVSPPRPVASETNRPLQRSIIRYCGRLFEVYVAQPGRHGPSGVWLVVTILRQHLVLGTITHSATAITSTQHLASSRNKHYTFFRNPRLVVQKEMPQYGFEPGYRIVSGPIATAPSAGRPTEKAIVSYKGTNYLVLVAQPGVRGPKGIWFVIRIEPV